MALTSLQDLPAWKAAKLPMQDDNDDFSAETRCGHNAVCIKEELVIWGGYYEIGLPYGSEYCQKDYVWSFNMDLDSWVRVVPGGKDIPSARSGACSALVWPHWYIMCGCTRHGNANDVYTLNLITLTWDNLGLPSSGPAALSPRDKAASWVHDNRIYLFGGYGIQPYDFMWDETENTYTYELEHRRGWNNQLVYLDLATKKWVQPICKGPKPSSRAAHAAINMGEGEVYMFGGRHKADRMNDLHRFNTESHTWSGALLCLGTVPVGRTWHSMSRASATEILVYGGYTSQQQPLDDAWLLNTSSLSWSRLTASTGHPRLWHTASTNLHGDILVFGGCENNILDEHRDMETSHRVLLLRTKPFSLERLCMHCIYKQGERLKPFWDTLPRQFNEWLYQKERMSNLRNSTQPYLISNVQSGLGPGFSQLCVLTDEDCAIIPRYPGDEDDDDDYETFSDDSDDADGGVVVRI